MAKQSVKSRKQYTAECKAESLRLAGTATAPLPQPPVAQGDRPLKRAVFPERIRREAFRFGAIGGIGLIPARLVSFSVAVTATWALNRRYIPSPPGKTRRRSRSGGAMPP